MAINPSPRSIDEDEYVTNQSKKASPLDCYFCNGLQKRMLEHREESGVPKGNRTYVDAKTPGKSTNRGLTASSISVTPVPLEPPSALTRLEAHQRQAFQEEVVQTSHTPDPLHEGRGQASSL